MTTEMKATHTPAPLFVGKSDRSGARVFATTHGADGVVAKGIENRANADRIVLCWNCHDDLLAMLEKALSVFDELGEEPNGYATDAIKKEIDEVIAKAKE